MTSKVIKVALGHFKRREKVSCLKQENTIKSSDYMITLTYVFMDNFCSYYIL